MPKTDTKQSSLSQLAKTLGVSRATASKAIRHCSGVDTETRERILRAARSEGALRHGGTCGIYCIFPDTPSFFWKSLRHGIIDGIAKTALTEDGGACSVKCNVYTHLRDETSVLDYLEEAREMDARCIVIAAAMTPAIRAALASLCKSAERLILLLSEYGDVPNAFYVGGDAAKDGAGMARRLLSDFQNAASVPDAVWILSVSGNDNVTLRQKGFCETLPPPYAERIHVIDMDAARLSDPKNQPSYLAAQLSQAFSRQPFGNAALYVPLGLPGLPLALEKRGLPTVRCYCHDPLPDADHEKQTAAKPAAVCVQDIYMQGVTAIRLAAEYLEKQQYPCEKRITVPSSIL